MPRVAGCDPGTSSLDILILADGVVEDQVRFPADRLRAEPSAPINWLHDRGPFDLIAGPSGYGLPLVHAADCQDVDLALMALVRPDERGRSQGIGGFTALLRGLIASGLPIVFLPGVIHLPSIPVHRKWNRIDLGTADKLAVAALALAQRGPSASFTLLELGSAFTACLVVADGEIVDAVGGTSGPIGGHSAGAWDGELAYLLSPLSKNDLFRGGLEAISDRGLAQVGFIESLHRLLAAMHAITPTNEIIRSGRMLDTHADWFEHLPGSRLHDLPNAWVKSAAQGAAILADGLAGGAFAPIVTALRLRAASGTVLDHILGEAGERLRHMFSIA